ncbi:MAG: transporter [Eubacteriales bacterium]|nr:transporter [Eubacteriales bacterium]
MIEEERQKNKAKYFILMHFVLLFLSLNAVCSKQAAQYDWFTFKWFLFYGLVIFCLGTYAIAWQIILKGLPLTVAFSNKAVAIFWGMFWGYVLFDEQITLKQIISAVIILTGIIIISTEKEPEKAKINDASEVEQNE